MIPVHDPRFYYITKAKWDYDGNGTVTISDIYHFKSILNTPGNLAEYYLSQYYYTDSIKFFEIADPFPDYDSSITIIISFIFYFLIMVLGNRFN